MSCENGKEKKIRKTNPRICSPDVYRYIASNSSLTKAQVRECFQTYRSMIVDVLTSDFADKGLTITLPRIGGFYFKKQKGRKNGSTYNMFSEQRVAENEMSHYILRFKVYKQIANMIKQKTSFYEYDE